jgi:hypothetical protein
MEIYGRYREREEAITKIIRREFAFRYTIIAAETKE